MSAILQPGDQVHLIWPSSGDKDKDASDIAALRGAYEQLGVNIVIVTTIGHFKEGYSPALPPPVPQVVAVFRAPTVLEQLRQGGRL